MNAEDILFEYVSLCIKNDGYTDEMLTIDEENRMSELSDMILEAMKGVNL